MSFETVLVGSCSDQWRKFINACWNEQPESRPSFTAVMGHLQELNNGKTQTLVDDMITRLEVHTNHLENMVAQRCFFQVLQ